MIEEILGKIVMAADNKFTIPIGDENKTIWDMAVKPLVDKTYGLFWPIIILVIAGSIRIKSQSSGPALLWVIFASSGMALFLPKGLAGGSQVLLFFLSFIAFIGIVIKAVAERL